MAKILLVEPGRPSESFYIEREMASEGIGRIATYTKLYGHEIKIVDMATYRVDFNKLVTIIKEYKPDIVGITSSTFNILSAYETARKVKFVSDDIFVVIGGAHATALPDLTLNECNEIDSVVVGEGEVALKNIAENPEKGIIKEDLIEDLDSLPFIDWSFFDYRRFKKFTSITLGGDFHKYPFSLQRGCPFTCQFCSNKLFPKVRNFSSEYVFNNILYNLINFQARFFYWSDATLLAKKQEVHEVCEKIIKSKINISLIVQSRADTIDKESVKLLRRAGCETLFIGVESGNEDILKSCGKNLNKDTIRSAVKIVKSCGIPRIRSSFIIGLEGDTRESIRETIAFSQELKSYGLNRASFHTLDIYPGTDYWNRVIANNSTLKFRTFPGDWASYSRLYPMTICGDISDVELKMFRDEGKKHFPEEF